MGDLILISDKTLLKKVGTPEFEYIISYVLSCRNHDSKIYLTPNVFNEALKKIEESDNDQIVILRRIAKFKSIFQSAYFIGEDIDETSTPEDDLYSIWEYLRENLIFDGDETLIISDEHSNIKDVPAIKIKDFADWCASIDSI